MDVLGFMESTRPYRMIWGLTTHEDEERLRLDRVCHRSPDLYQAQMVGTMAELEETATKRERDPARFAAMSKSELSGHAYYPGRGTRFQRIEWISESEYPYIPTCVLTIVERLHDAGYRSWDMIAGATDEALLSEKGIGKKSLWWLRDWIDSDGARAIPGLFDRSVGIR